jgi:hypothetical protein
MGKVINSGISKGQQISRERTHPRRDISALIICFGAINVIIGPPSVAFFNGEGVVITI